MKSAHDSLKNSSIGSLLDLDWYRIECISVTFWSIEDTNSRSGSRVGRVVEARDPLYLDDSRVHARLKTGANIGEIEEARIPVFR